MVDPWMSHGFQSASNNQQATASRQQGQQKQQQQQAATASSNSKQQQTAATAISKQQSASNSKQQQQQSASNSSNSTSEQQQRQAAAASSRQPADQLKHLVHIMSSPGKPKQTRLDVMWGSPAAKIPNEELELKSAASQLCTSAVQREIAEEGHLGSTQKREKEKMRKF